MERVIEILDGCFSFDVTINGKDFKDFKNRKDFLKEIIDDMDDSDLEHVLQTLLHHHPNITNEEYTNDSCEQYGDNNIYEKIIINK